MNEKSFSWITFELKMIENLFWLHRVPLVKTNRNVYMMTLKGQGQNLTFCQGQVRSRSTQLCHIAYHLIRVDKLYTLVPVSCICLKYIRRYCTKTIGKYLYVNTLKTIGKYRFFTFKRPPRGHFWRYPLQILNIYSSYITLSHIFRFFECFEKKSKIFQKVKILSLNLLHFDFFWKIKIPR